MLLRRCAIVLVEPREELHFDLDSLVSGGDGLRTELSLLALAPHLPQAVPVTTSDIEVLAEVPATSWTAREYWENRFGDTHIRALINYGLLIGSADEATISAWRERDERLRAAHWRTASAVSHYFGRWDGVRSGQRIHESGYANLSDLIVKLGSPPPAVQERVPPVQRIALAPPKSNDFDALLRRRATCRNFDTSAPLDGQTFTTTLHRVFGAQGTATIDDTGHQVIKRNSPSGGGLHPTEAYLLVQYVEGIEAGLYHYHPVAHALEPLRRLEIPEASDLALRFVAAQDYFATAPVLVIMVSRFPRSFWKYRNHAKAYRVATLDVGHLSQTLYLSATEQNLGAFVTGAINEVEIEQELGLDPLVESPLAICGFGRRSEARVHNEFDPLGLVWPPHEPSSS